MKFLSFLIVLFFALTSLAQSPGGVLGSMVWHKNIDDQDYQNYGNDLFNYHQYKYFNNSDEVFQLPLQELSKVSMFVVYCNSSGTDIAKLSTGNGVIDLNNNTLSTSKEFALRNTYSKPKFLSFIERQNRMQEDDEAKEFKFGGDDGGFEGGLAEVLIFDRLVSKKQRLRIESYFAIKYGISLPMESVYFNSQGEEIWNYKDHEKYMFNNVFLGRDDGSGLEQKQSRNVYSDFDLSIALTEFRDLNSENSTQLKDLEFFSISDNNEDFAFTQSDKNPESNTMNRIWEVSASSSEFSSNKIIIRIDAVQLEKRDLEKDVYLIQHFNESDLFDLEDDKLVIVEAKELDGQLEFISRFEIGESERMYFTFVELPKRVVDPLTTSLKYELFPNPILNRETFTFQVYNKEFDYLEYSITNKVGEVFYEGNLESNENGFYFRGELENEGPYFITVYNDLIRESFELIVIK